MTDNGLVLTKVGAYFESLDTLAVADLHLGVQQEAENRDYPEPQDNVVKERMEEVIHKVEPATVVFNGDTFHHTVPTREARKVLHDILEIADFEAVFIVGNHEEDKQNLKKFVPRGGVHDEYLDDTLGENAFIHGHEYPQTNADLYVIGHLHPAMERRGSAEHCFMRASQRDWAVLILPSPNPAVYATPFAEKSPEESCPILSTVSSYEYAFPDESEFSFLALEE